MAWFRLHESTLDSLKVQGLPDRLFKGWINMLCVASRHGGVLPSVAVMAFEMRKSEEEVRKLLGSLTAAKLVDQVDEGVRPHDWNDHQYKADVSTERVRAFRDRKRKRSGGTSETVSRNAPEQGRAEQTIRPLQGLIGLLLRSYHVLHPRARALLAVRARAHVPGNHGRSACGDTKGRRATG